MESEAQVRDARGEWRPESLPVPSPIFNGPWKPGVILKHLWNLLWPYNLTYIGMAFACWLWLTDCFPPAVAVKPATTRHCNARNGRSHPAQVNRVSAWAQQCRTNRQST